MTTPSLRTECTSCKGVLARMNTQRRTRPCKTFEDGVELDFGGTYPVQRLTRQDKAHPF